MAREFGVFSLALGILLGTSACSGGGSNSSPQQNSPEVPSLPSTASTGVPAQTTYTVSGSVTGLLNGRSVVIQLNGAQDLTVTGTGAASEPFAFPQALPEGESYTVTVLTQPSSPSLTCPVLQGSGTVSANVSNVEVACPVLSGVQLDLPSTQLSPVGSVQSTVFALFSGGLVRDVTGLANFTSGSPLVASVSGYGLISALSGGSSVIQASFAGSSATRTVSVSAATLSSISVSPSTAQLAQGAQQSFQATGHYSDGSTFSLTQQATWSSANSSIVTVGSSTGLAAAGAAGTSSVTATLGAVSGSASVTVSSATLTSLQVSPVLFTGATGSVRQLTATAIYSNNTSSNVTSQVSWTSSQSSVASVSSAGLVSLNSAGTATITATLSGQSSSAQFTVTGATLASVSISPSTLDLPSVLSRQFSLTGHYSDSSTQDLTSIATWSVSHSSLASISNSAGTAGRLTPLTTGATTVVGTYGGWSASANVNVTSATLSSISISPGSYLLPRGVGVQFRAQGTFSDASVHEVTEQVTWASSNTTVGTISNATGTRGAFNNVYTGAAYPFTNITATWGAVASAASRITVTPTTLSTVAIRPTTVQLNTLKTRNLKAYAEFADGASVEATTTGTWVSADPAGVFVSNALGTQGEVTTLAEGTAAVSCFFGGASGSRNIQVSNSVAESVVDQGVGLTAEFHNNRTLSSFVGRRIDRQVNYNWATGTAPLGVGDSFSIRWTGEVLAPATGTYTFFTQSDDGVRLWVNGTQLVNNWTDHASTENSGTISLTAGQRYPIRLEFYENGGFAVIELRWQGPGITKQIIPTLYLYP